MRIRPKTYTLHINTVYTCTQKWRNGISTRGLAKPSQSEKPDFTLEFLYTLSNIYERSVHDAVCIQSNSLKNVNYLFRGFSAVRILIDNVPVPDPGVSRVQVDSRRCLIIKYRC